MDETEYKDRIVAALRWKEKQLDQALYRLDKQKSDLEGYRCPENEKLYGVLLTDLQLRYNAICILLERQHQAMFELIEAMKEGENSGLSNCR